MKILVLGGTGAMGTHLVELLGKDGHEIFVTTRSNKKSFSNVNYVQGNAQDIDFLKSNLTQNWDVIIDFMIYSTPEFKNRINLLLNATKQYVFLSSARVYANSEHNITETSDRLLDVVLDKDYLSTDEYALTKARQENVIRDSGRNNWTIIRPYITYSETRLQLGVLEKEAWLYRALKGRTVVVLKDIHNKVTTMTYGLDVSKGIVGLLGKKDVLGEAFHITLNQNISWSNVLDIYFDVIESKLGFRPKVLLSELAEFNKFHSSNYQIVYDRIYNRRFNNSKIERYINNKEFRPVEEGIKSCLNDFLNNDHFEAINWKLEALKDRRTGEFTPLSEIKSYSQKLRYLIYRFIKN